MLRLALAALILAPPGAALAQPTPDQQRAAFAAMDANKDGKISKAEWVAAGRPESVFPSIDANRDGQATPAELQAFMARVRSQN